MGRSPVLVLLTTIAALVLASPAFAVDSTVAAEASAQAAEEPTPEPTPAPSPPAPDNSKSALTLLGGQSAAQTVTLSRTLEGKLRGSLLLPLRSKGTAASLGVSYLPAGNTSSAQAASVELGAGFEQGLEENRAKSVPLVFTLLSSNSPEALSGIVVLQPRTDGKAVGVRFELSVTGTGPALKGVAVQPEKLEIDVIGWVPFDGPSETSAGIRLSGPGVPALFQPGTAPPSFDLLLRSDNGDEAHATLTKLEQDGRNPASATAEVKIDGDLGPGKYEGAAPISSLSADAPKLSISLESGNSFVYALVVVFVGSLVGGALYLASNRSRRKTLLRDQVKSLLDNYERTLSQVKEGREDTQLPMWTLETYLGKDSKNWYRVKWNAIVDFDGAVQTIWSNIHWARDEEDLDEVSKQVDELRARIVRWVTVAQSIAELELVTKLRPRSLADNEWRDCETPEDTQRLLERIREIEPADDKAAKDLIDRINRQARWHTALAEAWHAKAVLTLDMTNNPGKYEAGAKDALKTLDLKALDEKASPESKRSAEEQVDLKLTLTKYMEKIQAVYKGSAEDLVLPKPADEQAGLPAPTLALVATATAEGPVEEAIVEESFTESEREEASTTRLGDGLRGTNATAHDGERIPTPVGAIVRRDFLWTASIALVTSAAYIPTIYNQTWGTTTDYVSAFAAGFLGKAAINWAAMPLFQSLRANRAAKPAATEEKAPAAPASAVPVPVPVPVPAPAAPPATGATPA